MFNNPLAKDPSVDIYSKQARAGKTHRPGQQVLRGFRSLFVLPCCESQSYESQSVKQRRLPVETAAHNEVDGTL